MYFLPLLFTLAVDPIPVVPLDRKEPVSYEKEIVPILTAKCAGCHSGKIRRGKYNMSTPADLIAGGDSGPAIVPGKSAESLLVQLAGRTKKPTMPSKNEEPLSPQELALIKLWIDQGARGSAVAMHSRAEVRLGPLPDKVHPVRALAISSDKSLLAVGRGHEVTIYDVPYGVRLRTIAAHPAIVESLAFSPDGKTLASGSFREAVLWDARTGEERRRLTDFADRVLALAFSPDGKLLATGGGVPSADGQLRVYDLANGKWVLDLPHAHTDTIFGVCFSPDGTKLATGAADREVKSWDLTNGKALKTFEGHTNYVLDVGWRADGKVLASAGADNDIKIWDPATGEQLRTVKGHGKQVTRLMFVGPSANILTCSGDATARLWNVDTGGAVRTFGGGSDFLNAAAASSDGQVIAAGGESGEVRIYDKEAKLVRVLSR
ncbi:MAG TPA: c-type cytochrome domain-containing protein [Gemmataceae bacterium]|jgi:WD40 repeat protein|nr:c-type cytochrome domain-containing protein [Gemmataceae bacterium]